MSATKLRYSMAILVIAVVLLTVAGTRANAHCDTMDGPVVKAAKAALASGDIAPLLLWIQPVDEEGLQALFARTLRVRKLSLEAMELADMYLFETAVRLHRAGEGEPYTGLKPAGTPVSPVVEASDRAIEEEDVDPLVAMVDDAVADGIRARFHAYLEKAEHAHESVASGREMVRAYVEFVHYVEGIYEAAMAEGEDSAHGGTRESRSEIHESH